MLPCFVWDILSKLFTAYLLIMIVYAVVSWIPSIRGRWTDYVAMVVEPVLTPVRRIIPAIGGLDLSFLVVIVVINLVLRLIAGEPCVP